MIRYEISEMIAASPERIFPYLSEGDRYLLWMAVSAVEAVPPDRRGLGSRWRMETKEGAFVVEVTGFEQDRRVAFDTVEGPFDWKSDFRLDPQGDGLTKITSSGEVTVRGARRLLQPVAAAEIRRGEADELVKLKALAEA